jgi:uncharacterized OsmC-like protein
MSFQVELRNVDGSTTAIGTAGPHALVVDRPVEAGGGGHGFNGGELLHLAVAGCISNDLFREAALRGIHLTTIAARVDGDYDGDPAVSTGISYSVELGGNAPEAERKRSSTTSMPLPRSPTRSGTRRRSGSAAHESMSAGTHESSGGMRSPPASSPGHPGAGFLAHVPEQGGRSVRTVRSTVSAFS